MHLPTVYIQFICIRKIDKAIVKDINVCKIVIMFYY